MSEHDPEFEDFLKRRRPLFRRDVDPGLEPPEEVDRLVLDHARDAIREPEPMRVYRGPRWAAPMAIAATLLLGLAFVFHSGAPQGNQQVVPEVRVENVSARYEEPPVAPAPPPPAPVQAPAASGDVSTSAVVVDLTSPSSAPVATPVSGESPAWRREPRTWIAEIDRLRAAGNTALADAEQAEFNRQHRALAVSPDR